LTGISKEHTAEEINAMIKAKKGQTKPKFSFADLILLLLYSGYEKPIYGKTHFMKEVFVFKHEVFAEKEMAQQIVFAKYHFGMFSEVVENIVDDLIFGNYIELIRNSKGRGDISIKLTGKGLKYTKPMFESFSPSKQEELKIKRRALDSHLDILNYAYQTYDDYLEKSKLKNRYKPIDWDDEYQDAEDKGQTGI